jgi:hypothetical protein
MAGDHTTTPRTSGPAPTHAGPAGADPIRRALHIARHLPHKRALLGAGALFGVALVWGAFAAGRARGRRANDHSR